MPRLKEVKPRIRDPRRYTVTVHYQDEQFRFLRAAHLLGHRNLSTFFVAAARVTLALLDMHILENGAPITEEPP
jgi:hypothetical protein